MELNSYFKDEYLTVGNTRDNCVFYCCDENVIKNLYQNLASATKKFATVEFGEFDKNIVSNIICQNDDKLIKTILTRNYVCAKIMLEIFKSQNKNYDHLENQLNDFSSGSIEQIIKNHNICIFPNDIDKELNNNDFKELIFIVSKETGKDIQNAINNFLSSRTKYRIKLFTNGSDLITRYDQCGNLIQSPHDFRKITMTTEKEKYNFRG